MKKTIALLLAVSSLAMSTTALADEYTTFDLYPIGAAVNSEHSGVSRNYTPGSSSDAEGQPNYGSPVFRGTDMGINTLPTYRSGDLLTFALLCKNGSTTVKVNEGDVLTYICSKQDDSDYNNYNVQFIDQVSLSPAADTSYVYCTYKLRDGLEDGRYKLEMRLNGITKTYSFLVGTPSVELLYVNEITDGATPTKADKYFLKYGDAYCFGKATITGGANFSQTDTDFGFVFNGAYDDQYIKKTERDGNELTPDAQNALQASLDNGNNQEIGGQAQYFFRMVFEDVYEYTVHGSELTDDEATAVYNTLPDVDVYLND